MKNPTKTERGIIRHGVRIARQGSALTWAADIDGNLYHFFKAPNGTWTAAREIAAPFGPQARRSLLDSAGQSRFAIVAAGIETLDAAAAEALADSLSPDALFNALRRQTLLADCGQRYVAPNA